MTNASLLARLRTMLDEASAAYWTDTEAYQALTDGQNALVAMAVSQYLQSMEKLVGTGTYAHLVEIQKEEIDVPYILQGLYSMQSGTVPSGNSSASFSGTVLTLIWALYNPGAATPLYPIRLRSIAGVHPVNYTNPNPFLNEISTAVNGYASFTQLPPASGAVGQFTIGNAGTNYVAGDFVKLSGGGANAVFLVATIGAGGVITGLTLVQSGSGYSVGGPYSTTTNSVSGAGCTISITQLGNATLTFESVSSSNSAAWHVFSLFPGEPQLKLARRSSIQESIDAFKSLAPYCEAGMKSEISAVDAFWTPKNWLVARRQALTRKCDSAVNALAHKTQQASQQMAQSEQLLLDNDRPTRLIFQFENGVFVGARQRS